MLVRELIEQLSEMPPELVVRVQLLGMYEAEALGAFQTNAFDGPHVQIVPSALALATAHFDYVEANPDLHD